MLRKITTSIVIATLACLIVLPSAWAANTTSAPMPTVANASASSAKYFSVGKAWIAPTVSTQLQPAPPYIDSANALFVYIPMSLGLGPSEAPIGSIVAVQAKGKTVYATIVKTGGVAEATLGISQKLAKELGLTDKVNESVVQNINVLVLPNTKGVLSPDEQVQKFGASELKKFGGEATLATPPVLDGTKKTAEVAAVTPDGATTGGAEPPDTKKKEATTPKEEGYVDNPKDFAEYRPLIGGTLLPGVAQDLGTHRVLTEKGNENAAYQWLRMDVLKKFANLLIGWTAAIAVVAIIFGAYQYLTAVGDAEQIKSAHKTITFSLIGVAIALLAFAVVQVIVNLDLTGETASDPKADTAPKAASAVDYCSAVPEFVPITEFEGKKQPMCDLFTQTANVANCSGESLQKNLRETAVPHTERQISYYLLAEEKLKSDGRKYFTSTGYDDPTSLAYSYFRAAQCDSRLQKWDGKSKNFIGDLLMAAGLAALGEIFKQDPKDKNFAQNPPQGSRDPTIYPPACGNYFLEKGEECDAGPKGSNSCGAKDAANACKRIVGCGNGVIEKGEQCDAGLKGSAVCGAPSSANACQAITVCGNYKVEVGEECDNGPKGSNTCAAPGSANACKKIIGCGNGVIETGEECDSGPNGSAYCGAPSTVNACKRVIVGSTTHPANVDYGTGIHYPRPEPVGPYVKPIKPTNNGATGNFVATKKPGTNGAVTTPKSNIKLPTGKGKNDGGGKKSNNKDGNGGGKNDNGKNGLGNGSDTGGGNGGDGGLDGETSLIGDTGNQDDGDTGLNNPFGLLAANALWDVDAPGKNQRPNLDTTGISLFDRPLLLLAAVLPGQVVPDSNPRGKILPCGEGSSCSVEIGSLPQSNFRDEFLPVVARLLIYATTSVAFVVFFIAGAMMVLSYGDAEMNKKAKNMLIWGIVGLTFAAAAYALVTGVLDIKFGTPEMGMTSSAEQGTAGDGAATPNGAAVESPATK